MNLLSNINKDSGQTKYVNNVCKNRKCAYNRIKAVDVGLPAI